ncbi:trypsin-like serine peptidase [Bernardetia sp. OM2101]|uniref:trypsin-like serine peptidase n=1 Tax=Bernardetia sp. OM2101 TaxID=3344876 RepID=UPI0035CE8AB8
MHKVTDLNAFPYSSVGLLVFKMKYEDGRTEDYTGTAFIVSSKGIFTAAHNLYDPDEKSITIEAYFHLNYQGEVKVWNLMLGKDGVTLPDQWLDDEDENYDMAVCVIEHSSFREIASSLILPVYDKLIKAGQKFNAKAIGFQEAEEGMYYDDGEAIALEEGIVLSSNMVVGASGGPWLNTSNNIVYGSTRTAEGEDIASPNNGVSAKELIEWLNKQP